MSALSGDALAGVTGTITVDLGCIARNWRALSALVAPAACAAVVKADAYGLGMARVLPVLWSAGCRTYFVATPDEGEAALRLAPDATIYVLDGLLGAAEALARLGLSPVLSTLDDIARWSAIAEATGHALPAALHLDTGLNRLGLPMRDARRLASEPHRLHGTSVELLISHLACADAPGDAKNRDQLVAFETLTPLFPGVPRSLAASDGLMLGPDFYFDMVRPGYALYGGQAMAAQAKIAAPVAAAVTVRARILSVTEVAPGESVGYSATWSARRPSRIATIAAGYADGIPRTASAADGETGGAVLICDYPAPIVGRVSMDLITVDVTGIPVPLAAPGGFATLIGPRLSLEQAGRNAATIGYEMLTRLGPRFKRIYLDDFDEAP
jgi:alanine racemase